MEWRRGSVRASLAGVAACAIVGTVFAATLPTGIDPADRGLETPPVDIRTNATGHKPDPAPPAPATLQSERITSGNPLWGLPLSLLASTRDRPIFSPSRRPPPPPVVPVAYIPPPRAPAKPAEPEQPRLLLVGTIAGESEQIGVFLDEMSKDVIRLKMGQDHSGWILRGVHGREATLEKNRRTVVLTLPVPGAKPANPALRPAPPPRRPVEREL